MSEEANIKKEYSAGGVVYREAENQIEVLLIEPNQWNSPKGQGVWRLPKGMIDDGENAERAAVREVREETGVKGAIEAPLGDMEIRFGWKGEKVHKTVTFYLMAYVSGSTEDHDELEVHQAKWMPIEEAIGAVQFKNERQILVKAKKAIESSDFR